MSPEHVTYVCSMQHHDACTDETCRCSCHGGLGTKVFTPDPTLIGAGTQ